jgi:hypothetical protein
MMTLWKKKAGPQHQAPEPTKLEKRVAMISTPELVTWAENALYVIGKEVTGWMRTKEPALLDEALIGGEALVAIINELKKRNNEL